MPAILPRTMDLRDYPLFVRLYGPPPQAPEIGDLPGTPSEASPRALPLASHAAWQQAAVQARLAVDATPVADREVSDLFDSLLEAPGSSPWSTPESTPQSTPRSTPLSTPVRMTRFLGEGDSQDSLADAKGSPVFRLERLDSPQVDRKAVLRRNLASSMEAARVDGQSQEDLTLRKLVTARPAGASCEAQDDPPDPPVANPVRRAPRDGLTRG